MTSVTPASLATHAFLRGMRHDHLTLLAPAATLVTLPAKHRLFEEGGIARRFWLIRAGRVALDLHAPGDGRIIIETLGMGDLVGLSWLFPPFQWQFGAETVQPTETFELDSAEVLAACKADPDLAHELTRRLAAAAVHRLQATRIRLLDVYGRQGARRD